MAENLPINLFSYGTLCRPEVQQAVFGRLVEGHADHLPGYRTEPLEIADPAVVATSGQSVHRIARASPDPADSVPGLVFAIGEEDLWAADRYEVAEYARTIVRLASGEEAWVYLQAEPTSDADQLAALVAAEKRAFALLAEIERAGIVAAGRTELQIEHEIYTIAARDFGVTAHWHDRVVRAGANTLCVAGQEAPDRMVEEDDIVFLDLGPVFGDWEADVGRSYVVGTDPEKHRLVGDLAAVFDAVRARFLADDGMTGSRLYAIAIEEAEARGWRFGGRIAGHLVGKYPYARSPAGKDGGRASPANTQRMRDPDLHGLARHWIIEVHLVSPDGRFGGFYERLLLPD